jgi:hypothetical protein
MTPLDPRTRPSRGSPPAFAPELTAEERTRVLQEEKLRRSLRGKNPAAAIVLSACVPGLGDLYCGSWTKAAVFFALDLLSFLGVFLFGLGVLLYIPTWIVGIVSAARSAARSQVRSIRRAERTLQQENTR